MREDAEEEGEQFMPEPLSWSGCASALLAAALLIAAWLVVIWLGGGGMLGPGG